MGRIGIAERQHSKDIPSVGNGELLLDSSAIKIADPASTKAKAPRGGRHVLDGLTAIDFSPARVGSVLEDNNYGGGVGDEFAGGAKSAEFA